MFGQVQQSGDELSTSSLGMGLYLTKLIVTQFSGEVSVKSVLGQGSQFGFTFEISEQNQVEPDPDRLLNPHYARRVNHIRIMSQAEIYRLQSLQSMDVGITSRAELGP